MEHVLRALVLPARLLTMLEKLPPAADPVSRPLPQVTSSSDFVYCESQKYICQIARLIFSTTSPELFSYFSIIKK